MDPSCKSPLCCLIQHCVHFALLKTILFIESLLSCKRSTIGIQLIHYVNSHSCISTSCKSEGIKRGNRSYNACCKQSRHSVYSSLLHKHCIIIGSRDPRDLASRTNTSNTSNHRHIRSGGLYLTPNVRKMVMGSRLLQKKRSRTRTTAQRPPIHGRKMGSVAQTKIQTLHRSTGY